MEQREVPFAETLHGADDLQAAGFVAEQAWTSTAEETSSKYSYKNRMIMRGLQLFGTVVSVILAVSCWAIFYSKDYSRFNFSNTGFMALCLYVFLHVSFGRVYHAYDVGMVRVSELVFSQSLMHLLSNILLFIVACINHSRFLGLLPFGGLICVQVLWSIAWCQAANRVYFRIYPPRRAAIIFRREDDLDKLMHIRFFSDKFLVEKYIKDPADIHQLIQDIEGFSVVFVVGIDANLRNGIAKYCIEKGVISYITPHVGDIIMAGAKYINMHSVPIMRVRRAAPDAEYLFVKRAMDIIFASVMLVIASPFMLIIAIAIKFSDGGQIFYKQIRLTRNRREFEIIKFRSMRVDAEKDGVARLAGEYDDRITPVGKIIRAIRFDELPQLVNVLGGCMTLVGPRPERPEIADKYEETLPAFSLRLQVKAGLTGYAQVYGRYNTEPYDKLQMDLMYINSMSLVEDLRLLFATVKILFLKESTEGVRRERFTAIDSRFKREDRTSDEKLAK